MPTPNGADRGAASAMLHRPENGGVDIYQAAINELFHEEFDWLTVIKWKSIYEKLDAAIDRAERVANVVEGVSIKYS
jgi:uncharacterized protein Yka (UPF0111/DUF47 family)